MVEVTQAVRDLIADYLESIDDEGRKFGAFRRGQCDNHPHAQAFQAAYNAGRAELIAELSEPTEAMVAISEPDMSGGFEGDVWFGHPEKRTLGTHVWRAGTWHRLPSEIEAVLSLLAKARKQRDTAIEGLVLAAAAMIAKAGE